MAPVLFVAFGTTGDVLPLFHIARRVRTRHRIVFVSHAAHAATCDWAAAGIEFLGTPTRPDERSTAIGSEYEAAVQASARCGFVVFNLFALGAWHIAEARGVAAVAASPCLIPYTPPAAFEEAFRSELPRLHAALVAAKGDGAVRWAEVEHWMWPLWTERWGSWRCERLGLPAAPMAACDEANATAALPRATRTCAQTRHSRAHPQDYVRKIIPSN